MEIERYSRPAIVLHWIVALLIVLNVLLAWSWPHMADDRVRPAIDLHKSVGISVLGLVLLRALWRIGHPPPALPREYAPWEKWLSHLVHGLLYLVMFGLPLSGWIMDSAWEAAASHPMYWFGLFEWPRIAAVMHMAPAAKKHVHDLFGAGHLWSGYALYALLALHIGGAIKHQVFDEQPELQRMLPE